MKNRLWEVWAWLHGIPKTNSSHLKIGRNPKGDVHLLQVVPGRVTPKKERIISLQPTISFKDEIVVNVQMVYLKKMPKKIFCQPFSWESEGAPPNATLPQEIRPY